MTSMRRRYVASTSLRRHVHAGNLPPPWPPNILNLGPQCSKPSYAYVLCMPVCFTDGKASRFLVSALLNVNGYTFWESNSFILMFGSHLLTLKEKKSPCSKFLPVRVDPILTRLHCSGKNTGSHKNCFLLLK